MIYLLDKPSGWTSFDLVKKVRNVVSETEGKKVKVGHAGTLDPLATGLMIVATGSDTKKLHGLTGLDKTYVAEFLLGRQTDTADREGAITRQLAANDLRHLDNEKIEEAAEKLIGGHDLAVPLYSAVKVDGRPLYWYARNDKTSPDIPTRVMKVLYSKLYDISYSFNDGILVTLELSVASGVYIRSLAEYFGELLGVPAMMWNLRRTRIGDYAIDQAVDIDELP